MFGIIQLNEKRMAIYKFEHYYFTLFYIFLLIYPTSVMNLIIRVLFHK